VVASPGIAGRFADRVDIESFIAGGDVRVSGRTVWFVLTASAGIDTETGSATLGFIAQLPDRYHATLVTHADGIWAFRWQRPAQVHALQFKTALASLPAWAIAGTSGEPSFSGTSSDWDLRATGTKGYVADQDYWLGPPGNFEARVRVADVSGLRIEVWDDTSNDLLSAQYLPVERGRETFEVPVTVANEPAVSAPYGGFGPFRVDPTSRPSGQVLEIRVWAAAGARGTVYSLSLQPDS
jgi:hypothetical protein